MCQDGATAQLSSAQLTLQLKQQNIATVGAINQLPPHSPELNPIEKMKIWAYMKQQFNQRIITNEQELIELVHSIWNSIPQETIQQYITHYQTVRSDLIQSGGDNRNEYHCKQGNQPY